MKSFISRNPFLIKIIANVFCFHYWMLELIFYSISRIFSHSSDSQSSMTKNIFTSRSNQNQSPAEMLWKEFNYSFQSPGLVNITMCCGCIRLVQLQRVGINIVLCAVNVLIIMPIFGHKLIRWPWSYKWPCAGWAVVTQITTTATAITVITTTWESWLAWEMNLGPIVNIEDLISPLHFLSSWDLNLYS